MSDITHLDLVVLTKNQRLLLTDATVAELLRELREQQLHHAIENIRLSGSSFGLASANAISKDLQLLLNLRNADLSDIIAGRDEDEALQVLEIIGRSLAHRSAHLEELTLSDNALGLKGISALQSLLDRQASNHKLQKLYLSNVGLDAIAAKQLAAFLLAENQQETHLTAFHASLNMLGDEGAAALAPILSKSPNLTDVRISSTRFGKKGGLAIANAIQGLKRLTKLDLSDNTFGGNVAPLLANTLKNNFDTLHILNLAYTSLEDDGFKIIAKSLTTLPVKTEESEDEVDEEESREKATDNNNATSSSKHSPLEELNLAGNDLTGDSALVVAKLLIDKPKLRKLKLDENELGNKGSRCLASVLKESKELASLSELELSTNEITTTGAIELAKAIKHRKEKSNQVIKLLLNDNKINEAGRKNLSDLLGENVSVKVDEDEEIEEEEEEEEDEDDFEALSGLLKNLSV